MLGAGGGRQGCSKAWGGSSWLRWAERGRTWVFEGLVEGAGPLPELELWRKALAGVPVCGGGRSLPGGLLQGRPGWKQAFLC